jgi:hypothetical protein
MTKHNYAMNYGPTGIEDNLFQTSPGWNQRARVNGVLCKGGPFECRRAIQCDERPAMLIRFFGHSPVRTTLRISHM